MAWKILIKTTDGSYKYWSAEVDDEVNEVFFTGRVRYGRIAEQAGYFEKGE